MYLPAQSDVLHLVFTLSPRHCPIRTISPVIYPLFLPSNNPSILCPVVLFSSSTTPFYSPAEFSSFTPLTLIFILPAPVHLPLSLSPSPQGFFSLPFLFVSPSVGRSVRLRWLMCSLGTAGVLGHVKVVAPNCTAFRADDRKEVEKCNVKAQL